jgi:tetratricopeptide (TPR) repeat protein
MIPRFLLCLFIFAMTAMPCFPETGYVTVMVQDAKQHPVRLVEIGVETNGGSNPKKDIVSKLTKDDGTAQLTLSHDIGPSDWITFRLVHSPPGKNLAIVSPWDYRMTVPPSANLRKNVINIVVVQYGDRAALENHTVTTSLAAKINQVNAATVVNNQGPPLDPKQALLAIAKQFGLPPEEIDNAIRALGATTNDEKEAGIIFLYERNYPNASAALTKSLQQSKQDLEVDQRKVIQDQQEIGETSFFLGFSLYKQAHYGQATQAYQESLRYRPNDSLVLRNLAQCMSDAGEYDSAETLSRRALAIDETTSGPNDPTVAASLNTLADLLQTKGDLDGAEPLFRRALTINEKALGPHDPIVAVALNNLANLLAAKGDFEAAKALLERAITIDEKAFGPNDLQVGYKLESLGGLLLDENDPIAAEPLFRRALAINEKALGPDHPDIAVSLNNLARSMADQDNLLAAEPLFRRALAINEKALGANHPAVANALNGLGFILEKEGRLDDAEPLYKRALDIDEKVFNPNHPDVATSLSNIAEVLELKAKADFVNRKVYLATAEPQIRRSLAIDEKLFGSDHPVVARRLDILANILQLEGDLGGAEIQFRRALAIDEKAFGSQQTIVARDINNLAGVLHAKRDDDGAGSLLRRALAINEKTLGPNNPEVAINLGNLGALAAAKGDYTAADSLFRRALSILESTLGPDHPATKSARDALMDVDSHLPSADNNKQ